MTKKCVISALFASVFFLFISPDIRAGEPVEIMAGEIIIRFKDGTEKKDIEEFEQKYGLLKFGSDEEIKVHFYSTDEENVIPKIDKIKKEPIIKYAKPNYIKKASAIPNDNYYSQQWYLPHINMPAAWDTFSGTSEVRVAVIDSGINHSHPDLQAKYLSLWEYDYLWEDSTADDETGHGTFVSGIVAATSNNGIGIAGISQKVLLVPLKTGLDTISFLKAMNRARDAGCKIINCSFGGYFFEEDEYAKISALNLSGILFVCAAGNGGPDRIGDNLDLTPEFYPASYDLPNIISVANTDSSGVLNYGSNYGATSVDIAAPGTEIFSTLGVGEVYRESIINYSFDFSGQSWQGFYSNTGGLVGFNWKFFESGWETDYNIYSRQYSSYSSFYLESPLIDCRNYANIQLITTLTGGLGLGDSLGIYSGTTGWTGRLQAGSLLNGWVNASFTRYLWPLENAFGRVWYWLTSDAYDNGYVVIKNASISGVPIYTALDGTSFSAPIIAGVAAMLMSQNPQLTHLQVKDIILQTARKVSALNGKVVCGGIVDAAAALREAKARIVVVPSITSSASASGTAGMVFSYTITASSSPTSYNATSLPSGLSINTSTGVISGTPSSAGTFTSSISASNTAGTASTSLIITIAKGTPTITAAPTASPITYGQTLASSTLSGGSASVAGNFSWTTSSAVPAAGTSAQDVTFTPSDTGNYNTATTSVSVTVNKASPSINTAPTASAITYGQTLASSTLSGGSASVAGNFSWTTTSAVPATGTSAQNVTFTPSDTANYNTATTSVSVTAIQAPPPPPRGLVITSDLAAVSINLGASFSHQITASGSPTSFGAIRLPPGLKINAKSGLISGKPTKVGVSSATLQALKKGSTTATATKVFTVVQVPTFSYAPRINAQRNKNVNVRPKVAGSPAPSFSVVSGSLPPGLGLNASTAAITGKPTTVGSYAFTVRGSNSAGNTDRSTTIVVK